MSDTGDLVKTQIGDISVNDIPTIVNENAISCYIKIAAYVLVLLLVIFLCHNCVDHKYRQYDDTYESLTNKHILSQIKTVEGDRIEVYNLDRTPLHIESISIISPSNERLEVPTLLRERTKFAFSVILKLPKSVKINGIVVRSFKNKNLNPLSHARVLIRNGNAKVWDSTNSLQPKLLNIINLSQH